MKDNTMEDIVAGFRKMYATSFINPPARLPFPLISEEDTRCRLLALYQLEVENRGQVFINDANTHEKINRVARWMFSSDKRGLILMGTMGNGKSTMLRIINRLFKGASTFGDAQDIFDHYKKSQGSMRYWEEPLLLIDDIGIEPFRCLVYGEEYYPISRLLLHRYDKQLTTIIATNLDIEDIAERYGDRVVDRMKETFCVIKYEHESYR